MTLGATGQVYITLAAARRFADFAGRGIEEARRELTEIAIEAKRVGDRSDPEQWRYRKRSEDIDISLVVSREPPLAVIVSINCRGHVTGGGQRKKWRETWK